MNANPIRAKMEVIAQTILMPTHVSVEVVGEGRRVIPGKIEREGEGWWSC